MANISITYSSESPGGAITATKWNQNAADVVNGLSDGTKDLTVANVNASAATLTRAAISNTLTVGVVTGTSAGTTLANAIISTFQRSTGTTVTTPDMAISSSSGSFTATGAGSYATPTDVTNLSVTITTTGRPVMVAVIGDGSGPDSHFSIIKSNNTSTTSITGRAHIIRGSTEIAQYVNQPGDNGTTASQVAQYLPSNFFVIDVVAAGTYTYKVQISHVNSASDSATTTVGLVNAKLIAFEL